MYQMQCCCLYAGSYRGRGHPPYQCTRVLLGGHHAMGGYKGPWYHCTVRAPVDSRYVAGELIARTSAGTVQAKFLLGSRAKAVSGLKAPQPFSWALRTGGRDCYGRLDRTDWICPGRLG
eukprot:3588437-Rhodomonas_salina.1